MSADHWRDELQKRLGELRAHVEELKAMDESAATPELQRRKQLDACGRRADEVLEARKNCDRAVRLVKDPAKRQEGKEALRAVDKEVRHLQDEVRRCELKLHHSHTVTIDSKATDEEFKKEVDRIQDEMKESYARQLKNLDRTLDVANATRDSVEQQGEQVKAIAEETERIGANLEAADVHVRRFKKEVSTDRVFHVLAVSNVAVLIALLTLVIMNRRIILDAIGL